MNLVYTAITLRLGALALVCVPFAWSQAKEFDVASIKPHQGHDFRVGIEVAPGGLFRATNIPLNMLMQTAYDLLPGQLSGVPQWAESEHYDIEAKVAGPEASGKGMDAMRPYLQSLLASRFQLKFHRENRDMQVYHLATAKGGPKMKEGEAGASGHAATHMGHGLIKSSNLSMDQLAITLSRQLGTPVVNQTGLAGQYRVELQFSADSPAGHGNGSGHGGGGGDHGGPSAGGPAVAPGGEGPTIFTALQEQLGLKLESKKGPMNVFIVDKIEKPEEN